MTTGFVHEAPGRGASVEYYTPPSIFEALGLEFDLDPCHPRLWLPWTPAFERYSLPEDGLTLPWFGRVWLNPPYLDFERACHPTKCTKKRCVKRGYHLEKDEPGMVAWLEKMHAHGNGVALVFARTGTRWFHDIAVNADALCFVKGRVVFVDANGDPAGESGAGADSLLIAWGEDCVQALDRSGLGHTLRNPNT